MTAYCPGAIKKLIIVGSPPFQERYASEITSTRLSRLTWMKKEELRALNELLSDPDIEDKDAVFKSLGELMEEADSLDPVGVRPGLIDVRFDIYQKVWPQASDLRRSGELLKLGAEIRCPVVAIHGDYDPHPAKGVNGPLSSIIKDFRFILLKDCGHKPWVERGAKDSFYKTLSRTSRKF